MVFFCACKCRQIYSWVGEKSQENSWKSRTEKVVPKLKVVPKKSYRKKLESALKETDVHGEKKI